MVKCVVWLSSTIKPTLDVTGDIFYNIFMQAVILYIKIIEVEMQTTKQNQNQNFF